MDTNGETQLMPRWYWKIYYVNTILVPFVLLIYYGFSSGSPEDTWVYLFWLPLMIWVAVFGWFASFHEEVSPDNVLPLKQAQTFIIWVVRLNLVLFPAAGTVLSFIMLLSVLGVFG